MRFVILALPMLIMSFVPGCKHGDEGSAELKIAQGQEVGYLGDDGMNGRFRVQLQKYTAQIGNASYGTFCSGVLIDRRVVLTAAHCVAKLDVGSLEGLSDAEKLNPDVVAGLRVTIRGVTRSIRAKNIHLHPEYTGRFSVIHDIAVMIADEDFGDYAGVRIANGKQLSTDLWYVTSGYGVTHDADQNPLTTLRMKEFRMPASSADFGPQEGMKAKSLAVYAGTGTACEGDSGGPTFGVFKDYSLVLYGTTQGGGNQDCKDLKEFMVVDLSFHLDFLKTYATLIYPAADLEPLSRATSGPGTAAAAGQPTSPPNPVPAPGPVTLRDGAYRFTGAGPGSCSVASVTNRATDFVVSFGGSAGCNTFVVTARVTSGRQASGNLMDKSQNFSVISTYRMTIDADGMGWRDHDGDSYRRH